MAGRVPAGADRSAVAMEMEDTFVQNLKHAAGVLSKVTPHLQHHNASLGPKWDFYFHVKLIIFLSLLLV